MYRTLVVNMRYICFFWKLKPVNIQTLTLCAEGSVYFTTTSSTNIQPPGSLHFPFKRM